MAETKRLRIFISYGRDDYSTFADRLKNDLIKKGYEVWFDKDKIKGGSDWEKYIEDGIHWVCQDPSIGRVVFIITPHSARRPDGYCLNELSKLLMLNAKIIPVMLVYCEPPLSIYRLQWLDAQDCISPGNEQEYERFFTQLLDALQNDYNLNPEGLHARLISWLNPIDFGSEIFNHLKYFTGRSWMYEKIKEWQNEPNAQKVLILKGEPGTGKTAFSAFLIHNFSGIIAYHFFKASDERLNNPINMVKSIAFQMSTQLPEYREKLAQIHINNETDACTLFNELITRPLFRLAPPQKNFVILLDALDEAKSSGLFNEISKIIAEEFPKTPSWLRLIVTTRPEPDTINPLARFNPVSFIHPEEKHTDIRDFLKKRLKHVNETFLKNAIETIIAKSEGNFLFASAMCDEIDNNCYTIEKPKEFPFGMADLFSKSFEKRFSKNEYATHIVPVLQTLITAMEPLSIDYLSVLLNISKTELNTAFFLKIGSFCNITDNQVQLFHKSLADWLMSREQAIIFYIDKDEAEQAMAQSHLKLLQTLIDEPEDIEKKHDYCIKWALVHLYRAKMKNELQECLLKLLMNDLEVFENSIINLLDWVVKNTDAGEEKIMKKIMKTLADNDKVVEKNRLRIILNSRASYYDLFGFSFWALQLYKVLVEINKKNMSLHPQYNDFRLNLSGIYENIGKVYSDIGDKQKALSYYEKSLLVIEELVLMEPERTDFRRNLCGIYINIGKVYSDMGDAQKSLFNFKKSLQVMEELVSMDPDLTDFRFDLSELYLELFLVIYFNLGEVYSDIGDTQKALFYYEKSLQIGEELVSMDPDRTDFRFDLSIAYNYNNLGKAYSDIGDTQKALFYYEKSLQVLEELVSMEPDRINFRHDLLVGYINVGNIYELKGNTQKALFYYEKSLQVLEELVSIDPDRTDFRSDLSIVYNNLGKVYSDIGDKQKSLFYYEKSLQVMEKLVSIEPDRTDFWNGLSTAYNNLGKVYSDIGDTQKALFYYEKSLQVGEELVSIEPDRIDFRHDLLVGYINVGYIYQLKGNTQKALSYFDKGLQVMEKLVSIELDRKDFISDYVIILWNIYLVRSEKDEAIWLSKVKNILQQLIDKELDIELLWHLWKEVNDALERLEKN